MLGMRDPNNFYSVLKILQVILIYSNPLELLKKVSKLVSKVTKKLNTRLVHWEKTFDL